MHKSTALLVIAALSVTATLVGFSGCRRRPADQKSYDLKGKVVAVEQENRRVTISHEDIKGYMPAMVMTFAVKEREPFEILAPGDLVQATLVVNGSSAWIEQLFITEGAADAAKPNIEAPGDPKVGDEVPNFTLVNQDSKAIRIRDYRGKALVLTFIYTRCPFPDQCILMNSNFNTIDQEMQKQPDLYKTTHLLTISFDTEYDTPKVLRSYGAATTGRLSDETFEHWEFATGSKDAVKGLAQFFGMRYFHDTESGENTVIHTLRTAIIGPDGKVFRLYRGNDWKTEQVISELRKSLADKAVAGP